MKLASPIDLEQVHGFAEFLRITQKLQAPDYIKDSFDDIEEEGFEVFVAKTPELAALLIVNPRKKLIMWACGQGNAVGAHRYPPAEIGRKIKQQAESRGWRIKPTAVAMSVNVKDLGRSYGVFGQIRCGGQIRDVDDLPSHVKGRLALEGMPEADISNIRKVDEHIFGYSVHLRNSTIQDLEVTDPKAQVRLEYTGIQHVQNVRGGNWHLNGNPGLTLGSGINVESLSFGGQHIELPADLQVKSSLVVPRSVKVPHHLHAVTDYWEDFESIPVEEIEAIVSKHKLETNKPDIGLD